MVWVSKNWFRVAIVIFLFSLLSVLRSGITVRITNDRSILGSDFSIDLFHDGEVELDGTVYSNFEDTFHNYPY